MSRKENPDTVKARNAKPDRMRKRSAQGKMWESNHRELINLRRKGERRKEGIYAQMIDDQRNPITVELDNVAITSDWHVPFTDETLIKELFAQAEINKCENLIVAGDFWDCDSYSRFVHLTAGETFKQETEEVRKELKRLLAHFDHIYICRGNHEKRFCDLNAGKVGMKELFALARPSNISEDDFNKRVTITLDDHIYLIHKGELWLICHPKNFRIVSLSVAKDLAAKNLCNVATAHGHAFAQGRDRSGRFKVIELGGMFDKDALDYLRETTCHPSVKSGFYIMKDGCLIPVEGK